MSNPYHDTRAFFDAIAARYDRMYALGSRESRRRMAGLLEAIGPAGHVLDLGVGTGRELPFLLDAGHVVTAVDISPAMLARCARRRRAVELVRADFWSPPMPLRDGAYDSVIALHSAVAHPPEGADLKTLTAEVARLLKPEGAFFAEITTPEWIAEMRRTRPPSLRSFDDERVEHVDPVTNAAVTIRVWSPEQWREAFGPQFDVSFTELRAGELLVRAKRAT